MTAVVAAASSPVYVDSPDVEFRGDGPGSQVMVVGASGAPAFVVGVPRVSANGFAPGPAVRPDLFGRLDATAAPSRGRRWGVEIGPTSLWQVGGALDRGQVSPRHGFPVTDGWAETKRITVELAVAAPPGRATVSPGFFLGTGVDGGPPGYPFQVVVQPDGTWAFRISTQQDPYGPCSGTVAVFTAPPARGTRRITIQADATGPATTIAAWVDGVRAAGRVTAEGPAPGASRSFARNIQAAFVVGQVPGRGTPPFGQPVPAATLLGLCVSPTLRYDTSGAPGSPQERLDGQRTIPDAYRYFPWTNQAPAITDPKYLAALNLTEDPSAARAHLSVSSSTGHGSVMFVADPDQYGAGRGLGNQAGNALKDLSIDAGLYGAGVLQAGGVLTMRYEGCRINGGPYAIAVPPQGANYPTTISGCTLQGSEACFLGWFSVVRLRDTTFTRTGRVGILTTGSSVDADTIDVAFSCPNQESFAQHYAGEYGGAYTYRNVAVDNEARPLARSGFSCARSPYGTTRLRLTDIYFAQLGKGAPFIDLDDAAPPPNSWTHQPAVLIASGLRSDGACLAPVRVNGPGWGGSVRDSVLGGGVVSTGRYGAARVTFVDPTAPSDPPPR